MTEPRRQCSTCRFWEAARQACRRNPPVPHPVVVMGVGPAAWPRTAPTDWCGEWKVAVPKAEDDA